MEPYFDSDASSESEYESDKESTLIRDCEEDDAADALEPELIALCLEDYGIPFTIEAQIQAQHYTTLLAQLHSSIKA